MCHLWIQTVNLHMSNNIQSCITKCRNQFRSATAIKTSITVNHPRVGIRGNVKFPPGVEDGQGMGVRNAIDK